MKREDLSPEALVRRARQRLLFLLDKRDYTAWQLKMKLKRGGYPEEVIEDAVRYVIDLGIVNDRNYARRYIECRKQSVSLRKIEQDLALKGVNRELLKECIEEAGDTDERPGIMKLLKKRRYDAECADAAEKRKQFSYLLGKGYKPGDISYCLECSVSL
ncbi:MAG: recombination regulator RecX [Lachnospiraceae bacterium]|nr:recombination regulator RecX [Lachnospiraceae bacterium]